MIDTVNVWHKMIESRDIAGLDHLLSDDVVFFSPVVQTPQSGKTVRTMYLTAAYRVFLNDTFRYVREVVGEHDAVLEFIVEIDGVIVNGVDMLKWNDDGKLTEFKVMLRPLKAVNIIHEKMAAMLIGRS